VTPSLPPSRCMRDRALTGGEAAPLDEPWRASHRSGHDDAKALLQAHRHVISRGFRRTGDAEPFAGGQDAQQIFLHGWMAGLAPQSHRGERARPAGRGCPTWRPRYGALVNSKFWTTKFLDRHSLAAVRVLSC